MVGLDEAHATHISSKIEDLVASSNYLGAIVKETEIYKVELVAKDVLLQKVFLLLKFREFESES
jgi:hypothetical protein